MNHESTTIILFSILTLTVLTVIIAKVAAFFAAFNRDTRFLSMELSRAYSDNEYRYWRRELRCHYLTLIPFVNERNVIDVYKRIYHKPKHFAEKKRVDGLYHMLAPSIVGIVLCCVCLCGVSWAWFSASQSTGVTKIETARFTVDVTAGNNTASATCTSDDNGIYTVTFPAEGEYTVTLTPSGSATKGFCGLELKKGNRSEIKYTEPLTPGTAFEFKVRANGDVTLLVTPQWGTCASESIITNGSEEVWSLSGQNTGEPYSQVTPQIPAVSSPAPEAPEAPEAEPETDTADTTSAVTAAPNTEPEPDTDGSANTADTTESTDITEATDTTAPETTAEGENE